MPPSTPEPAPAHATALRRAFGAFQLTCALSISLGRQVEARRGVGEAAIAIGNDLRPGLA